VKRGLTIAPFDALSDPRLMAELAADAERAGLDGVFVWDHIQYSPPVQVVSDPWVVLSAMAMRTSRVLLGPLVTPVPRRRPVKLARETVTLDRLCGGRLVFGAGLGHDGHGELSDHGEETDDRARARLLDAGLDELQQAWAAAGRPIPVWLAARWPNRRPVRRAARFDGLFPIDLPDPDALATLAEEVAGRRRDEGRPAAFDLVVDAPPGTDPEPWEAAGATWLLSDFGPTPSEEAIRAEIRRHAGRSG
jgi:alkanesulfonate monooxygenase SsuD/methylene tetrahydromethanopterin reductase-like flavin-dependent oxidoreductase (luciferase family)